MTISLILSKLFPPPLDNLRMQGFSSQQVLGSPISCTTFPQYNVIPGGGTPMYGLYSYVRWDRPTETIFSHIKERGEGWERLSQLPKTMSMGHQLSIHFETGQGFIFLFAWMILLKAQPDLLVIWKRYVIAKLQTYNTFLETPCQVARLASKYNVRIERIKEGRYIVDGKINIFVRVSDSFCQI